MLLLAQVDSEVQRRAAEALITNPWLWVCIALFSIVALGLFCVWYYVKKIRPDELTARALERKERAERHAAERLARKEEKEADRKLYENIAVAAITHATETARNSVTEAHKEIGERVADVKDEVSSAHETSRNIHKAVLAVAQKLGVTITVVGILGFSHSTPSPYANRPRPDMRCNPRCPRGQVCSGSICTVLTRPRPKMVDAQKKTPPAAPVGPQTLNQAIITSSWTDGRDPFEVDSEILP
jgi:hypothetical protein